MKFLLPVLLLSVGVWAQTQPPPAGAAPKPAAPQPPTGVPQMVTLAPSAPAELPPDTVVATIEGKKFTAGDFQRMVAAMPGNIQQNFQRDRKEFLRQFAVLYRLSEQAEKGNLSDQTPYKERLIWARMQVLWQAEVDEMAKTLPVMPDEQKAWYANHPDSYAQAKIKVIYIPYSASPGPALDPAKKSLNEAEAKAKAEDLVKQARAGADFVKLVKENSADPTSRGKDGDFGTLRRSANIPDNVKKAIFSLKKGEISDAVKQQNGFYIFRAEDIGPVPYEQVKDDIYQEIKQSKLKDWFEETNKKVDIKIDSEAYFTTPAGHSTVQTPAGPIDVTTTTIEPKKK